MNNLVRKEAGSLEIGGRPVVVPLEWGLVLTGEKASWPQVRQATGGEPAAVIRLPFFSSGASASFGFTEDVDAVGQVFGAALLALVSQVADEDITRLLREGSISQCPPTEEQKNPRTLWIECTADQVGDDCFWIVMVQGGCVVKVTDIFVTAKTLMEDLTQLEPGNEYLLLGSAASEYLNLQIPPPAALAAGEGAQSEDTDNNNMVVDDALSLGGGEQEEQGGGAAAVVDIIFPEEKPAQREEKVPLSVSNLFSLPEIWRLSKQAGILSVPSPARAYGMLAVAVLMLVAFGGGVYWRGQVVEERVASELLAQAEREDQAAKEEAFRIARGRLAADRLYGYLRQRIEGWRPVLLSLGVGGVTRFQDCCSTQDCWVEAIDTESNDAPERLASKLADAARRVDLPAGQVEVREINLTRGTIRVSFSSPAKTRTHFLLGRQQRLTIREGTTLC